MSSILADVRHAVTSFDDDTSFDKDIILFINGVLMTLNQIGVGPSIPYQITGVEENWSDFLGSDERLLALVKPYVIHKVQFEFDTPTSSTRLDALREIIAEDEWRLNIAVDPTQQEIVELRSEMEARWG